MNLNGRVGKPVESVRWQDYRASDTGMVMMYSSDPVSEMPIREVPEQEGAVVTADPNYESGTYGFFGCVRPKIRAFFIKSKFRYLFFMTKYAGARQERQGKVYVTGMYRIASTADALRLHLRYLPDAACIGADNCVAMRADEVRFLKLDDALELTPEVLKKWEHTSKLTRQSRIALNEEQTVELVEYFRSRDNALDAYIEETRRLEPSDQEEEEDEEINESTNAE